MGWLNLWVNQKQSQCKYEQIIPQYSDRIK